MRRKQNQQQSLIFMSRWNTKVESHSKSAMYKLKELIIFCFVLKFHEFRLIENDVEDYIEMVTTYYSKRNVMILTHFSCFSQSK